MKFVICESILVASVIAPFPPVLRQPTAPGLGGKHANCSVIDCQLMTRARFRSGLHGKASRMTKFATALAALTLVAGLAACGSSSGSSSTATQQTTTAASQPPAQTTTAPKGVTQQLTARAGRLLSQLASETGSLASGQSATEQQARTRLAQLQADSRSLAQTASQKLAPSNPVRPLIVQAAHRAGKAAATLSRMKLNASTRQALRNMQTTLSSLSASVGKLSTTLPSSGATTITNDLQALQRLVTAQSNQGATGS
jgi:hypothetical protein